MGNFCCQGEKEEYLSVIVRNGVDGGSVCKEVLLEASVKEVKKIFSKDGVVELRLMLNTEDHCPVADTDKMYDLINLHGVPLIFLNNVSP